MNYKKIYDQWITNDVFDEDSKRELLDIKDNEKEIEDRFYKELEFGTAGLRGKLGAGTNRMNKYIVARATQGFSQLIKDKGNVAMKRGVVIAYDNRLFSEEFAKTAALVLAGNGIKTYLFESLRPTPELSFAVRELNAIGGINITASHNPKEYNGYKVYWEEGSQILEDIASGIIKRINEIEDFSCVNQIEEEAINKGLLEIIGQDIDDKYMEKVKELTLNEDMDKDIKIVYTPLNGAGNVPVRRILKEREFNNVFIVSEQEKPDPYFTTVKYPNPEDTAAFELAIELGKEKDADILIATDPDCDRLAVMVKDNDNEYVPLNGNQTGALLINYILKTRKDNNTLPMNSVIVKSIVTGDLGKAIAKDYGVETIDTLTGFKYVCGKANEFEKTKEHEFLFGYEESIGYVYGTFVRDKDAVISAMLVAEMAAYFKKRGKTLLDVLSDIYEKYGYYKEKQISIVLEGIEGKRKIDKMMQCYKDEHLIEIGSSKLVEYVDFSEQSIYDKINNTKRAIDIPKSNGLKFTFDDESWYAVRPSGTEPKIKLYIYVKGESPEDSDKKLKNIEEVVVSKLMSSVQK